MLAYACVCFHNNTTYSNFSGLAISWKTLSNHSAQKDTETKRLIGEKKKDSGCNFKLMSMFCHLRQSRQGFAELRMIVMAKMRDFSVKICSFL